ncbi:MAG: DeoR/GlpR family DNA-binding transcription regulator [Brevinema sp.]
MKKISTRQEFIANHVNTNNYVSTEELSELCGVTTASIRADLRILEAENIIIRTPGGAKSTKNSPLDSYTAFASRGLTNVKEKELIAAKVLSLIEDGMTILLDSSTTISTISKQLALSSKKVTIITHCFIVNNILQKNHSIKQYFCGGRVREDESCCVGESVIQNYNSYFADIAILSPQSVHLEKGFLNSDEETTIIKQHMMKRVTQTWVCADSSKFDKISAFPMCSFGNISRLITDTNPGVDWQKKLIDANVELILP